WRVERKTRKKRSRRMSTLAGCTHAGSNGSMPIRPDTTAARMSRSDRTTTLEYGGVTTREREHGAAQLGPRADDHVRAVETLARVTPGHLHRAHFRAARHLDVGRCVPDHDAGARPHAELLRGGERELGCGLVPGDGVAAEVGVDLVLDAQPAQDPLAIRGALFGHRSLHEACVDIHATRH